MKKLILLLVLVMTLSVVGVLAETQDANATVSPVVNVSISPATLGFGTITPGNSNVPAINGPITFGGAGSNVNNITFKVQSVTTPSIFENIELETSPSVWTGITSLPSVLIFCTGSPCAYTPATWAARISVPIGYPAGFKTGVITYLVSGPTP